MPLSTKEIAEHRKRFAATEMMPYTEMAKQTATLSSSVILPVIINIVEEIKSSQTLNIKEEFLEKALKGLKEYDELQGQYQSFSFWTIKEDISKLLSHLSNDIKTDLDTLVETVKKVEINPKLTNLWYEAACWLEGFYQRRLVSDTSKSIAESMIDSALKLAIGLNQTDIAFYYHQIADEIIKKITPTSEKNAAHLPTLFNATSPTLLPKVPSSKKDLESPKYQ